MAEIRTAGNGYTQYQMLQDASLRFPHDVTTSLTTGKHISGVHSLELGFQCPLTDHSRLVQCN